MHTTETIFWSCSRVDLVHRSCTWRPRSAMSFSVSMIRQETKILEISGLILDRRFYHDYLNVCIREGGGRGSKILGGSMILSRGRKHLVCPNVIVLEMTGWSYVNNYALTRRQKSAHIWTITRHIYRHYMCTGCVVSEGFFFFFSSAHNHAI